MRQYAWPDLVRANLTVLFIDENNATRYPAPAGTSLGVVSHTETKITEYDFPTQTWWNGHAAAVEDGQVLLLQGTIQPGVFGFFLVYENGLSTGVNLG
jgi:hypothetical protein